MAGPWQAGNNGTGPRIWFVFRAKDAAYPGGTMDVHSSKSGNYIRYAKRETAARVAERLNRAGRVVRMLA